MDEKCLGDMRCNQEKNVFFTFNLLFIISFMFLIKLFTAGIGTLYIIEVSLFAFGTLGAFNVSFLKDYFTLQPVVKRLMYYEFLISTATELSLQLIMTKIIIIQLVKLLGGFSKFIRCE